MADMDEGSKAVLPIGIVVTGKNVAPNTAQLNTESPATSGSQNQ